MNLPLPFHPHSYHLSWAQHIWPLRIPRTVYLKSIVCCHMSSHSWISKKTSQEPLYNSTQWKTSVTTLKQQHPSPYPFIHPSIYLFWSPIWPPWCWRASWNTPERSVTKPQPCTEALSNELPPARKMPSQALVASTCSALAPPGLPVGGANGCLKVSWPPCAQRPTWPGSEHLRGLWSRSPQAPPFCFPGCRDAEERQPSQRYLLSGGPWAQMPAGDRPTQQAGVWTINSHLTDDRVFRSGVKKETVGLRPTEERSWRPGADRIGPGNDSGQGMCVQKRCARGLSLWQLGLARHMQWVCSTTEPFSLVALASPSSAAHSLRNRFKEQVLHCRHCCYHYYIILSVITPQMLKIKLNKCISQWPFLFKWWTFFFSP